MKHDWDSIIASKAAYRRKQAALPIAEKFRQIGVLRRRSLLLREAGAKYLAARDAVGMPSTHETEAPTGRD